MFGNSPFGAVSFAIDLSSTDVVVSITGQNLAVAQGNVSVGGNVVVSITGLTSSVQQQILIPTTSLTVSGQVVTISQGSLLVVNAITLSGQSVSLTQGNVTAVLSGNVTVAISGLSTSLAQGNVSIPGAPVPFNRFLRPFAYDITF